MYVCCFNNFTLVFEKDFFFQTTKQNIYCIACHPLVGHAVIASDYRAGGTWFDTRCGQSLYQRWCSLRTLVVDERVNQG